MHTVCALRNLLLDTWGTIKLSRAMLLRCLGSSLAGSQAYLNHVNSTWLHVGWQIHFWEPVLNAHCVQIQMMVCSPFSQERTSLGFNRHSGATSF